MAGRPFQPRPALDPAISGTLADPTGDGIVNFQAYAFGIDPWAPATLAPVSIGQSGSFATVTFPELQGATDVRYYLQVSCDMVNWSAPNSPVLLSSSSAGSVSMITLQDTVPITPGGSHFLRVMLVNSGTDPLTAPSNPTATVTSTLQVRLNWTDNTQIETGFVVERMATGDSEFQVIGVTGPDATSFVDTTALGNTAYTYRILAEQVAVLSNPSPTVSLTTPANMPAGLANTAVQLVMGQIQTATAGASLLCWASQPGMLRTWDQTGNPSVFYKLYSSGTMQIAGSQLLPSGSYNPGVDVPSAGIVAAGTDIGFNACYADLNFPVASGADVLFPIIDPRAAALVDGTNMVNGFSFDPTQVAGASFPASTSDKNAMLPMPVQWIYVTQSGQTVSPDAATSGSAVTFYNSPVVSGTNPIVGRIAFWTDDETCKLNINTATEGSAWEVPMFSSYPDVAYAQFQPVAHEYSRYPGHPATTSLSPVLWSFFSAANPSVWTSPASLLTAIPNPPSPIAYDDNGIADGTADSPQPTFAMGTTGSNYWASIMQINPFDVWGGSEAGTQITLSGSNAISLSSLDSGPLYTDVDSTFAANAGLTVSQLNEVKFFLTANSTAPDLNPFNLPKVCMWPITANPSILSPGDATLAGASSGGNNGYYFTRSDPTTSTGDVATRNQQLYNYIRNQLDQAIPGFGGSFTGGKWNALQCDQILTNIYDYIRSCINLVDSSVGTIASPNYAYSYTTPPTNGSSGGPVAGTGQVVPISITNPDGNVTKGIGRFPTIRGATLQFIARSANQPPLQVYTSGPHVGCPVLFDSSGNQTIADSQGNITTSGSTTLFTGKAYAMVNPMHPWTCPEPGLNNTLGLMPQLLSSGGYPVFATNGTTPPTAIYPIFKLADTNTSGTPPTRTYPALDTGNSFFTVAGTGATLTGTVGSSTYKYVVGQNVDLQEPSYTTTITASSPRTHAGLEFLPVQRCSNAPSVAGTGVVGAFDLKNQNYSDTNPATGGAP